MMTGKPRLAVIEGLDGCGKSTQFELCSKKLAADGISVKPISFPDYEQPSSVLVRMYLDGKLSDSADDINAYAAASFYAVDRYASFKQFWEKDYLEGKFILAARYVTSNLIYQMSKLDKEYWEEFTDWLYDYEYERLGLPKPDKVLFLDMPLEVSQKLLAARYKGDESKKDIHEADMEYMKRCREAAYFSAEMLGWEMIDYSDGKAPLPVDVINDKIMNRFKELTK